MAKNTKIAALIVAAGQGSRAGGGDIPKQYQTIGDIPILARTLRPFLDHEAIDSVQIVIHEGQRGRYEEFVAPHHSKLWPPALGGTTRQASVRNGLSALASDAPSRVLIHDGARPFITTAMIDRVVEALDKSDGVIPTLPVRSTLKHVDGGRVTATVPRENLEAAETPQGFDFAAIHAAHEKAAAAGLEFTDDAAVGEWAGMTIQTVPGDCENIKLTTAEDIAAADWRLRAEAALRLGDVRVGVGYDIHRLGAGGEVMLGGIGIPHTRGLVGHSDADVVLHALTDAVLGALGDGDIGEHFPPSDDRWKGAASAQFLADAASRVRARGGIIAHLDVSYVGEGPKIAPHREAIRASIAAICGVGLDRVGVKATTNEGLGFIGRGEGVAAHAVATIRLPFSE